MSENQAERPPNPLLVPKRRQTVLLFREDVARQLEQLSDELDALSVQIADLDDEIAELKAEKNDGTGPPTKMGRKSPLEVAQTKRVALDRQRDEKSAEVDAVAVEPPVTLVFEEPTSTAYDRLVRKHPPRDGDRLDGVRGWNGDEFPPALVRLCLVEPAVDDEQWAEFRESVSAYNWRGKILPAIYSLTDTEPDLPKPFAVSALRLVREREQKRHSGTE